MSIYHILDIIYYILYQRMNTNNLSTLYNNYRNIQTSRYLKFLSAATIYDVIPASNQKNLKLRYVPLTHRLTVCIENDSNMLFASKDFQSKFVEVYNVMETNAFTGDELSCEVYKMLCKIKKNIILYSIAYGHLYILENIVLPRLTVRALNMYMLYAVIYNRFSLFKFFYYILLGQVQICRVHTMSPAFIDNKECRHHFIDTYIIRYAALYNRVDVIDFLYDKHKKLLTQDKYICYIAIRYHHERLFFYLKTLGCRWDYKTTLAAVKANNLNLLTTLYELGCSRDIYVLGTIRPEKIWVFHCNSIIFNQNMYKQIKNGYHSIIRHRNINLLDYVLKHDPCPPKPDELYTYMKLRYYHSDRKMKKYIRSLGPARIKYKYIKIYDHILKDDDHFITIPLCLYKNYFL